MYLDFSHACNYPNNISNGKQFLLRRASFILCFPEIMYLFSIYIITKKKTNEKEEKLHKIKEKKKNPWNRIERKMFKFKREYKI